MSIKIEEYEFSDKQVKFNGLGNKRILWFLNDNDEVFLTERDVIALAKHFKITADDLIT